MSKQIHNPVEVVLSFNETKGVWEVSGWVKYHMTTTEYPDLLSKDIMLDLNFSDVEKANILAFASSVIYTQIAEKEEI